VLTYTDLGLNNGQTWYYMVSAVNSKGEGSWSAEASATPATTPTAPQNLVATAGTAQVILQWTQPSSYGGAPAITAYKIYCGTISGEETLFASIGDVFTYTVSPLTNGVAYYFKISAVNWVGEGPLSNEVLATPATMPSVRRTW
jgi:predicted phage tail protein